MEGVPHGTGIAGRIFKIYLTLGDYRIIRAAPRPACLLVMFCIWKLGSPNNPAETRNRLPRAHVTRVVLTARPNVEKDGTEKPIDGRDVDMWKVRYRRKPVTYLNT